jgi:hypothetical protein
MANDGRVLELYGYHGTSMDAAIAIIQSGFKPSNNDYDWLGEGVYFWQDAPIRAGQWAKSIYPQHPAVIKSRIRLNNCIDLLDIGWIPTIKEIYNRFANNYQAANLPLPTQNPHRSKAHRLDCAFFDYAVTAINRSSERKVETIRAVFLEGENIYPNSAIYDLAHVQIAVKNMASIVESTIVDIDNV